METITEEEDEETRNMRLRFLEILHTVTASTEENIEDRAADEAEERSSKSPD